MIFWSTDTTSVISKGFFSHSFLDFKRFLGLTYLRELRMGWGRVIYSLKMLLGFKVALFKSATFFCGLSAASKVSICFLRGLAFCGLSPRPLEIFTSAVAAFCSFPAMRRLPGLCEFWFWPAASLLCFRSEPIFLRGEFSFCGDLLGLVYKAAFLNGELDLLGLLVEMLSLL